jgi:hypothetical protein
VNVVGYVNVTLQPGFNLVSVPLVNSNASINTVLSSTTPVIDAFSAFIPWRPDLQQYDPAPAVAGGDGAWYLNDLSDFATNQIDLGQGFFINNAGAAVTLTLVGTVPQGSNTVFQWANNGFYGDPIPMAGSLATNVFPITATFSALITWDPIGQTFSPAPFVGVTADDNGGNAAFFDNSLSFETNVVLPIGSGFLYNNLGGTTNWSRVFNVTP